MQNGEDGKHWDIVCLFPHCSQTMFCVFFYKGWYDKYPYTLRQECDSWLPELYEVNSPHLKQHGYNSNMVTWSRGYNSRQRKSCDHIRDLCSPHGTSGKASTEV